MWSFIRKQTFLYFFGTSMFFHAPAYCESNSIFLLVNATTLTELKKTTTKLVYIGRERTTPFDDS